VGHGLRGVINPPPSAFCQISLPISTNYRY
jgi:hypothetical protein